MIKICIFGTGTGREKFEKIMDKENVNVVAYIDNDVKKLNSKINGIEVISPLNITNYTYDYILIASDYYEAIIEQLNKLGIRKNILSIYKKDFIHKYLESFSQFMTSEGIELIKLNYKCYGYINYNNLFENNEVKFHPTENELVDMIYRNRENYKIEYNLSNNCEKELCVIYFSSNGVYNPNIENEFIDTIIKKDIYEWYCTRIQRAHKNIFIRDIYKQWYINGINSTLNSTNKLLDFLRKETLNYNIICVGSSAGGYAAILYGILLNAQYVLSFSPQFKLNTLVCAPINEENRSKHKYCDLRNLIKNSSTPIFYFYPCKSEIDIEQYEIVKKYNSIHTFIFADKEHGIPLSKNNLNYVINLNLDKLFILQKRWNEKIIDDISFLNK